MLNSTGVAYIGGHWRHVPHYSVTQNCAKMHQNTSFSHQKSKNFLDPFLVGRGVPHTPLKGYTLGCTSQVPSLQLDPGYATAEFVVGL